MCCDLTITAHCNQNNFLSNHTNLGGVFFIFLWLTAEGSFLHWTQLDEGTDGLGCNVTQQGIQHRLGKWIYKSLALLCVGGRDEATHPQQDVHHCRLSQWTAKCHGIPTEEDAVRKTKHSFSTACYLGVWVWLRWLRIVFVFCCLPTTDDLLPLSFLWGTSSAKRP